MIPYLAGVPITFSMSVGVTGGGGADGSSTRVPISAKNLSIPDGVAQHSILAGMNLLFVNLWRSPLGEWSTTFIYGVLTFE